MHRNLGKKCILATVGYVAVIAACSRWVPEISVNLLSIGYLMALIWITW